MSHYCYYILVIIGKRSSRSSGGGGGCGGSGGGGSGGAVVGGGGGGGGVVMVVVALVVLLLSLFLLCCNWPLGIVSARKHKSSNFNPIVFTLVLTVTSGSLTAELCGIDVARSSTIIYNLIRLQKSFGNEAGIPHH
jgi:hypothetical protein